MGEVGAGVRGGGIGGGRKKILYEKAGGMKGQKRVSMVCWKGYH